MQAVPGPAGFGAAGNNVINYTAAAPILIN